MGRRALLTRGGVVAAGVVGVAAAGVAGAGAAGAATGSPVLQGEVNAVGTDGGSTEIDVVSNATADPTLVLGNAGVNGEGGSPALRLTPSAQIVPSAATVGGDFLATSGGNLWFTHATTPPMPAIVHTDANSNSFVPLIAPVRLLDTRTSAGRKYVLDPSGKFDSTGRLLAGQTIHLSLLLLVNSGDAVHANITVTQTAGAGFVTVWSGSGSTPTASTVNFAAAATLSNFCAAGIAQYSADAVSDSIAIFAHETTQVIVDVAGFSVYNIGLVNPVYSGLAQQQARQALRARPALRATRWQAQ